MTTNELLNDLSVVIKRAAKSVEFQWPNLLESGDIEQEILLRLFESPGSAVKIHAMDDRARYRAIVGIGHQVASRERIDYDHYKGSYRYSVGEVKKLLNRGVLNQGVDGFNDAVIDLMEALESLVDGTPQYVEAVVSRYADDQLPTSTRERDALHRGLTALADAMNKSSRVRFAERDDGVGTRDSLTNAQARQTSSSQYDGENLDWSK